MSIPETFFIGRLVTQLKLARMLNLYYSVHNRSTHL